MPPSHQDLPQGQTSTLFPNLKHNISSQECITQGYFDDYTKHPAFEHRKDYFTPQVKAIAEHFDKVGTRRIQISDEDDHFVDYTAPIIITLQHTNLTPILESALHHLWDDHLVRACTPLKPDRTSEFRADIMDLKVNRYDLGVIDVSIVPAELAQGDLSFCRTMIHAEPLKKDDRQRLEHMIRCNGQACTILELVDGEAGPQLRECAQ